nr:hypothetical protein 1 [Dicistroviridae sp.]
MHHRNKQTINLNDFLAEESPNCTTKPVNCMFSYTLGTQCHHIACENNANAVQHTPVGGLHFEYNGVHSQMGPCISRDKAEIISEALPPQNGENSISKEKKKYVLAKYSFPDNMFEHKVISNVVRNNVLNNLKPMHNLPRNKFYTYRRLAIELMEIMELKVQDGTFFEEDELDFRCNEFGFNRKVVNDMLYRFDVDRSNCAKKRKKRDISASRDDKRKRDENFINVFSRDYDPDMIDSDKIRIVSQGLFESVSSACDIKTGAMNIYETIRQCVTSIFALLKTKAYDGIFNIGMDVIKTKLSELKWFLLLLISLVPVAVVVTNNIGNSIISMFFDVVVPKFTDVIKNFIPTELHDVIERASNTFAELFLTEEIINDEVEETIPMVQMGNEPNFDRSGFTFVEKLFTYTLSAVGISTTFINMKRINTIMKFVGDVPRLSSGIMILSTWLISVFETVVNYVRVNLMGYDTYYFVSTKIIMLDEYKKEVFEMFKLYTDNKFPIQLENKRIVDDLYMRGRSMLANEKLLTAEPRIKTIIPNLLKMVDEVKTRMSPAESAIAGYKVEPLAILLYGKSGVGKSAMTLPFLSEVITAVGPENIGNKVAQNQNAYIYSRNITTDFWDGYYGQFACVYDDFMQAVDSPGINSEALEIIKTVNTFPYALHSASLEEKGNNYFTSRIVFCSTNNRSLETNAIREKEALARRFDIVAEIKPAAWASKMNPSGNYAMIDKEAIAKLGGHFCPQALEIHVREGVSSDVVKVMSYDQFVAYTTNKYKAKTIEHEARLHDVMKHTNAAFKRRTFESLSSIDEKQLVKYCEAQMGEQEDDDQLRDNNTYAREIVGAVPDIYMEDVDQVSTCSIDEENSFAGSYVANDDDEFERAIEEQIRMIKNTPLVTQETQGEDGETDNFNDVKQYISWFCGERLREEEINHFDVATVADALFQLHRRICTENYGSVDIRDVWNCIKGKQYRRFLESVQERSVLTTAPNALPALLANTIDSYPTESVVVLYLKHHKKKKGIYGLEHLSKIYDGVMDRVNEDIAYINNKLTNVKRHIEKNSPVALLIKTCAVLGSVIAAYKLLSGVFGAKEQELIAMYQSESSSAASSGDKNSRDKLYQTNKKYYKPRTTRRVQFQGGAYNDKNAHDVMKTIYSNNVFELFLPKNSTISTSSGCITFITSTYFVMPGHFSGKVTYSIDNGEIDMQDSLYIRQIGTDNMIGVPAKVFHRDNLVFANGKDYCIGSLGKILPAKPSITKHFISNNDAKKLSHAQGGLWLIRDGWNSVYSSRLRYMGTLSVSVHNSEVRQFSDLVGYDIPTAIGDCGNLLSINDKTFRGKIIGIHVAGDKNNQGFSQIITNDDILALLKKFINYEKSKGVVSQMAYPKYDIDEIINNEFEETSMVQIKRNILKTNIASKTKLKRTKFASMYGEDLIPAKLRSFRDSAGIVIDPYQIARNKYCKRSIWNPNYSALDYAIETTRKDILEGDMPMNQNLQTNVISFEEAILGSPGHSYFDSLNRNTSPGYPYNAVKNMDGSKGKFGIFGVNDTYELDNPKVQELKKDVMNYIMCCLHEENTAVYYTDSLKDELRPRKKADSGQTRLVSCSPLVLTIVTRMYFLQVCRYIYFNKVTNGVAVGINALSDDWDLLHKLLTNTSENNCFSGDFKNFDGSEKTYILSACGDILSSWYGLPSTHPDNVVRSRIISDLYNSVHIRGDEVFVWEGSLASGNPLTSVVNSIYNNIAFRYCWSSMVSELDEANKDENTPYVLNTEVRFRDHVYLCTYGDDNVLSVDDKYVGYFTPDLLKRLMAELGLTLTNSDKDKSGIGSFTHISNVDFLKRKFVPSPNGKYLGALNKQSIYKSLAWVGDDSNELGLLLETASMAELEMSIHGKGEYDIFASTLNKMFYHEYGYTRTHTEWYQTISKILQL